MKKLGQFIWPRSHNGIYLLSTNSVSLYIIPEEIPHVQGQRRSPSKTVQFSWGTQSCLTLCDPMNRSTPGLPVHHQLPEFTHTHVHRVSEAIQPSHPLQSSGSFLMSQLFTWGGQSIGVSASASVPPMNTQDWSPLGWTDLLAVQGTLKSLLQHHSSKASILWRSTFFIVHSYIHTWPLEKP